MSRGGGGKEVFPYRFSRNLSRRAFFKDFAATIIQKTS